MSLSDNERQTIAELIRRAVRSSYYVNHNPDIKKGLEIMTIALAMQAGVTTYLQAELDFIGDINRIDSGLVGHAGMLIITRNQAWDDYTREVRESSPDSVEARSLKTKYAALDYRCEEFVQRHPAEFLYAMMGLINGD